MALKGFRRFDNGTTSNDAYTSIETMKLDHIHGVSFVTVCAKTYLNEGVYHQGVAPIESKRYTICEYKNWTKRRARNYTSWASGVFEDDAPDERFQFFVNQASPIHGGYNFLKTLPEYAEHEDV